MNTLQISLNYNRSIIVTDYLFHGPKTYSENEIISFVQEMQNLGFIPSEDFLKLLRSQNLDLYKLYDDLIPELACMVGDNVDHKPMYPNFPTQVANMSDFELYFNAFVHYISLGEWLPEYEVEMRAKGLEPNVKYKVIDVCVPSQVEETMAKILQSPDSITEFDREALKYVIAENIFEFSKEELQNIPFAETRCIVLAQYLENDDAKSFGETLNNMTDILRVATWLSDGDISLAKNTKFKNFKRGQRRFLTKQLETFWDMETASRHKNKWVKLLHSLHVGDYSKDVWEKSVTLRENLHIETFNGNIEARLKVMDIKGAIKLLATRPSEFARRLDHLLRLTDSQSYVINEFNKISGDIPSKILIQLVGHFENRTTDRKIVVLPKGQDAKAVLIDQKGELDESYRLAILHSLRNTLMVRFSKGEELGKVYIDPALKKCPVPSGMRSVPNGLVTVPRGTQFDFGDDNVLRFFVHWIGKDIDLSASFHDEDFNYVDHVSYTNLRSGKCLHSGDVTRAPGPNGANEYIDIDVEYALSKARYVAMNVYVYSGPNFSDHEEAFIGWMTRSKADKNEIFEAKTVKQKLDLTNDSRIVCPVIFDMKERKAIFVNMTKRTDDRFGGVNVESNKAGIEDILYAAVHQRKMSLYELFNLHCLTRSTECVENPEDADLVFAVDDGDITPRDWLAIQTDWIGE